ncbi:hypothetical protein ACU4HD_43560 [Cupriavidus basilensis]
MTRNLQSEVARANVACKANLADDTIRFGLQPAWQTQLPEGLDPCLPKDLLKVFTLATQGVKLTPESLKGCRRRRHARWPPLPTLKRPWRAATTG